MRIILLITIDRKEINCRIMEKINFLLNQYYIFYRSRKDASSPFLLSEIYGKECTDSFDHKDCCAIDIEKFKLLCMLINIEKEEEFSYLCCSHNKLRGTDDIRFGEVKRPRNMEFIYPQIQIAIISTFTTQYNEDNTLLKSLINILMLNDLDSEAELFLEQYSGDCSKVMVKTKLGMLLYQAFKLCADSCGTYKHFNNNLMEIIHNRIDVCKNKLRNDILAYT